MQVRLLEVLDEGDDQCALGEEDARYPLNDGDGLMGESEFKIGFRDEGGGVEFLERLRNALGLRTREAPSFEFLDDAVGVDHQCLHTPSVYHLTSCLQGVALLRTFNDFSTPSRMH
jgi:hypothetical protein